MRVLGHRRRFRDYLLRARGFGDPLAYQRGIHVHAGLDQVIHHRRVFHRIRQHHGVEARRKTDIGLVVRVEDAAPGHEQMFFVLHAQICGPAHVRNMPQYGHPLFLSNRKQGDQLGFRDGLVGIDGLGAVGDDGPCK